MKTYILLLIIILGTACKNKVEITEIETDKAIIPEGIAIHPTLNKIYLSSINKKKIIEYDYNTGITIDFIESNRNDYKSGVGMEIKDDKLFTLSNEKKADNYTSLLSVYDLEKRTLLHSYVLNDGTPHFLNDLAIDGNNRIYITDTKRSRVYKLDYPEGKLEVFLEDEALKYPNGIAISDQSGRLFVASWVNGIQIINMKTSKILKQPDNPSTGIGIDGLKYHMGNLYAITNNWDKSKMNGLVMFELNEDQTHVLKMADLLTNHSKMDIPTTLCIRNNNIYLIANSQLPNFDQKKREIINPDQLNNTFIIKYGI